MPIFNSTEFLTVPQQVNKNKKDISLLDGRVTVVENAILGNTSIVMTDVINVAALGVANPLGVAAANAIKTIITYNYNNPNNYQMFGAKVAIPATIVNDSIVFPGVADIVYDTVFEIQAKQEINPITESYTYVAQGDSPEFSFTIYFNYRFDIGTWEPGGDPVIIVQRQADQKYILEVEGETTALAQGVAYAYPDDAAETPNFSGTMYLYVKAAPANPYRLYAIARYGCSPLAIYGVALGANGVWLTKTEASALHAGHHMSAVELWGRVAGENYYKLIIIDDRNRKLLVDDYASVAEVPVNFIDTALAVVYASQANTQLATGSPATASKFANKDFLVWGFDSATNNNVTLTGNLTIDGNIISTPVLGARYKRTPLTGTLSTGWIAIFGTNSTGGAITITGTSTIVFTASSAAMADYCYNNALTVRDQCGHFVIQNNTTLAAIIALAIISRSGNTITIQLNGNVANTLTVNDTVGISSRYSSL